MAGPAESFLDASFPKGGVDLSAVFGKQPVRPDGDGNYVKTTPRGLNVRVFDPTTRRQRGGQRPGLVRFIDARVSGGEWVIQNLASLSGVGYDPPGGEVPQSSLSGRVVQLVAVSEGEVFTAVPEGTEWVTTTNNSGETPPLNVSGLTYSAQNNQKLYMVDGVNYVYYKPTTNSVELWTATAGTLPKDADDNTARLICTWRGRTVLAGLLLDPQNWFMSAVSDPHDFDYAPASPSETQAVAGNNSGLGLIGDVVTVLIPYTDDVLVFGGDHTIYMMRGDPMAGGQIDLVSDSIGMAWGVPWCKDPNGTIYFFSNRTGIYTLVPGQQPVRVSQGIDQYLEAIDTGTNVIHMQWDDRGEGLHVFVTPLEEPGETTHFFYEARAGAWWPDRLARTPFDPLCSCVLDGNRPEDRVVVIGSWDGYVRAFDPAATQDDKRPIESEVVIGPILTKNMDEVLLKSLQAVLGDNSGPVTYSVHVGATAETALDSPAVAEGTWLPGRNDTEMIRASGHAIYVRITAKNAWQFEQCRALVAQLGKVRGRSRK